MCAVREKYEEIITAFYEENTYICHLPMNYGMAINVEISGFP